MNMRRLRGLQAGLNALFAPAEEREGMAMPSVARLLDRSPELIDAADQVAAEQRGSVLIVAQQGDHCRWLLAQLRRQPPVPRFRHLAREGLFTLACLSGPQSVQADSGEEAGIFDWRSSEDEFDLIADDLLNADLVLFVVDNEQQLENGQAACDTRTFARLRASGTPVLPILLLGECARTGGEQGEALRRLLGVQPVLLAAPHALWDEQGESAPGSTHQEDLLRLIERMLLLRPRLAIPLAQEAPFCRRLIANRVIRTGAWMTALVGLEPIPIIDLPLQVALQWKVVLQLAAIYGRPGLDVRSKEMASTVGASVLMRLLTQQLVKLLPLVGWMLSGLVSGLSTLLIGHAFVRMYEYDRVVDLRAAGSALQHGARRTLAPVQNVRNRLHFVRRREGGHDA